MELRIFVPLMFEYSRLLILVSGCTLNVSPSLLRDLVTSMVGGRVADLGSLSPLTLVILDGELSYLLLRFELLLLK